MTSAAASGIATASVGIAGALVGAAGIFGDPIRAQADWLVPLVGVDISVDPVGGFFMALTGAVAVPVGIYTIGYARREHLGRVPLVVLPLFVAAMLLVPAAGSIPTFLLAWELMAVASIVLVSSQHSRPEVRSAATYYAVLTQLGFGCILVGTLLYAAAADGDQLTSAPMSDATRTAVFVLTLAGFGSKAGLLPLHAWLPRAHPEAPSPVSALMSAAMVNLGIYGIVRFDVDMLGPGPTWWSVLLLVIGGASAVYGVLHACVAADLKRLLAYSTTENMGLVALALGTALLLTGSDGPAAVAMTAVFVHLVAHAAFKTLGFLAAGSVLAQTGTRDLDRLGGLAKRMPATTILFGIAALGATGLPLGAGFVSEWLLVQSLIHGAPGSNDVVALAAPLAIGAVALTTGLGVAAMVKALGIGFLARPRSEAAVRARESSPTMVAGMTVAALCCIVLGVAPLVLGPALRHVLAGLPVTTAVDLGLRLQLPGIDGSIAPLAIAGALVVAVVAVVVTGTLGARRRPAPVTLPLWACGAADLSPRMQYTATSFAEPLQRVFDDVLRPDTDVAVTHFAESQYLVERIAFQAKIGDAIEQRLYLPVARAVTMCANAVRRAHNGSIHAYLAYGACGVLLVVAVAR